MMTDKNGEIFIKVGPKGSTDEGEAWDDGAGGQVKQICIWYDGDVIYGIQTTYERDRGSLVSPRHGSDDGNFELVCLDGPLTWISGHYASKCTDDELYMVDEDEKPYLFCKVIKSLKFGTHSSTYGPFGCEEGEPFIFKATTGIRGFHGRSYHNGYDNGYSWLYSIGVWVSSMATRVTVQPPALSTIIPDLVNKTEALQL